MPTTVYLEKFSGAAAVNAGMALFAASVQPLTGPEDEGSYDTSLLSLNGVGSLYNNAVATTGVGSLASWFVTVEPMASGSVTVAGISQRDASGVIPHTTETASYGGDVFEVQVSTSPPGEVGVFFHYGYKNVKARDNPDYTAFPIGRYVWAEVDFPAVSNVNYPVNSDPFHLRVEFQESQYEVFVNGVSAGVRPQSTPGALYQYFGFNLWSKSGISSIQIDRGLVEPGGPRPGGEILYPRALPGPISAPFQAAERRQLSSLPGDRNSRPLQRDRLGGQELQFWFSHEQCAVFTDWLENTLIDSGAWFWADWPIPQGGVGVRRFIGEPSYPKYHNGYGWLVSAVCEVRGRGALPRQSFGE